MHPYTVIVHKYRGLGGISPIPDVLNTFTCKSPPTNDAPRDHLLGPVTVC